MQRSAAKDSTTSKDVARLMPGLPALPSMSATPVMVVLSGLPGTGKSHFAEQLSSRCPILVLESDAIRKALLPEPTYVPWESARTFAALHALAEELLQRNISVLIDATNLIERNRQVLYGIAERSRAKLILVMVTAPPSVVRERLERREKTDSREDKSDADWGVYMKMRSSVERIPRQHYVLDTSRDIFPIIEQVAREACQWIYDSSAKEEAWKSK